MPSEKQYGAVQPMTESPTLCEVETENLTIMIAKPMAKKSAKPGGRYRQHGAANIAACVFGTLCHLSVQDAALAIKQMFGVEMDGIPTTIELKYCRKYQSWENCMPGEESQSKHSDLMIFLSDGDQHIRTIFVAIGNRADQQQSETVHPLAQQYDIYKEFYKANHGEQQWQEEAQRIATVWIMSHREKLAADVTAGGSTNLNCKVLTWRDIVDHIQDDNWFDDSGMLEAWRGEVIGHIL